MQSSPIRAIFTAIVAAFAKLPGLTGNGGKIVRVNAGGTALEVSKVTITEPATSATLTIPDGVTFTGPAASGTAATLGNTETITGVKTFGSAGAVGRLKVAGTTSGTITIDAPAVAGSGVITLPATGTLATLGGAESLSNKNFLSGGTVEATTISASGLISANGGITAPIGQVIRGNTATGQGTGSAVVGVASTSGSAVYGDSANGYGVHGNSSSSIGVYGISSSSSAVFGNSTSGYGVHGNSGSNYGVVAEGDMTSPVRAAFRIVPQDAQPTGATTANAVGDMYVTTAGVLKICTVAGTPGTWVSVGAQT